MVVNTAYLRDSQKQFIFVFLDFFVYYHFVLSPIINLLSSPEIRSLDTFWTSYLQSLAKTLKKLRNLAFIWDMINVLQEAT